jgi:hypothetical protein
MVFLGVEPRSVRVVLASGLCDLGGITSAEGLRDGEAGRAPFLYALAFALQLRKSTENFKTFLGSFYGAGSRWGVGYDSAGWWSGTAGCYLIGDEQVVEE